MKSTAEFSDTPKGLAQAAQLLAAGGVVAFPTETVFGLGADARNSDAVAKIYAAKGRPSFNPLIAHVTGADVAKQWVTVCPLAQRLMDHFWPGALTLVLPLKPDAGIADAVTAGLPTLAVRAPDHPTAQALLAAFDGPLAAPSANMSGKISPTTADHVRQGLSGRIDGLVLGAACSVGLESTIVSVSDGVVTLLRPGGVTAGQIKAATGTTVHALAKATAITAPGQLASHYAPSAPVRLNAETARDGELYLGFGDISGDLNLSDTGDLAQAAENLFAALHTLDKQNKPIAVAPIPETGIGLAINDRLRRAAAPRD